MVLGVVCSLGYMQVSFPCRIRCKERTWCLASWEQIAVVSMDVQNNGSLLCSLVIIVYCQLCSPLSGDLATGSGRYD